MERNRHIKNIFIFALVACIISLSIAFAVFSQNLNINGTVNVASQTTSWNISFDEVHSLSTTGYATGSSYSDSTYKTITFNCEFLAPNDNCELSAQIVNRGTVNALFESASLEIMKDGVLMTNNSSSAYSDEIITIDLNKPTGWIDNSTILKNGDSGQFSVNATLNDLTSLTATVKYTITVKFNFVQADKD